MIYDFVVILHNLIPFLFYTYLIKVSINLSEKKKNIIFGILSLIISSLIYSIIFYFKDLFKIQKDPNMTIIPYCTFFVITYYNFIKVFDIFHNNFITRIILKSMSSLSKSKSECAICLDNKNTLILYFSKLNSSCEQCSCKLCYNCFDNLLDNSFLCPLCRSDLFCGTITKIIKN